MPPPGAEEDASVVQIEEGAAPRLVWSGEDLIEVRLPPGARVLYPPEPLRALRDVEAAVRYAMQHPEGAPPLAHMLKSGMKVSIVLDDVSWPLPQMARPDLRQTLLEIALDFLEEAGVDEFRIVIARGLNRRMTPGEIRRMLGNALYERLYPERVVQHDAENAAELKTLTDAAAGVAIDLNRRVADSDLILYLNLDFAPLNRGPLSLVSGLGSARNAAALRNPAAVAALLAANIRLFHVEVALNNRMYGNALEFLATNEDQWKYFEKKKARALQATFARLKPAAKRRLLRQVAAPYECVAAYAGDSARVHEKILRVRARQTVVRTRGQADILALGLPHSSPYSVGGVMNPLHAHAMVGALLAQLSDSETPLLKPGGAVIVFFPCREEFDLRRQAAAMEFYNRILPALRDSSPDASAGSAAPAPLDALAPAFIGNTEYVRQYREDYAAHPAQVLQMWRIGEAGRRGVGRIIVVGAEHPHAAERLGWIPAANFEEALALARAVPAPEITLLRQPPFFSVRCT